MEEITAQTQQKEQQAASLEKKLEKIQKQQIAVQKVEQIETHAIPFSSKVMLDRSEYENLAAAAKKFYVQERKESKLQKALEAALKMVNELKTKVAALTAELAEHKSVRGQLRTVDLEKENGELRGKLRKYEDVISRHNLWSYFSQHRRSEIVEESRDKLTNRRLGFHLASCLSKSRRRNILSTAIKQRWSQSKFVDLCAILWYTTTQVHN